MLSAESAMLPAPFFPRVGALIANSWSANFSSVTNRWSAACHVPESGQNKSAIHERNESLREKRGSRTGDSWMRKPERDGREDAFLHGCAPTAVTTMTMTTRGIDKRVWQSSRCFFPPTFLCRDSPRNAGRREWNTFVRTMVSFSLTTKANRLQLLADRRVR